MFGSLTFPFFLVAVMLSSAATGYARCIPCERGPRSPETQFNNFLEVRVVSNPHITSPQASTVWTVGSTATVTWDSQNEPSNAKGKVVLGHMNGDESNEHLDMAHPLADGFDLRSGSISFPVPSVKPASNYIIVLFGDSGNRSPKFTIQ